MNRALQAQLEQLSKTLAHRNNQSVDPFSFDEAEQRTPQRPPERPAAPVAGSSGPDLSPPSVSRPLRSPLGARCGRRDAE